MKTRIVMLNLAAALAIGMCAQAQTKTVRDNFDCGAFKYWSAVDKTHVDFVDDTICYVQVKYDSQKANGRDGYSVRIENGELLIHDSTGLYSFELHVKDDGVENVASKGKSLAADMGADVSSVRDLVDEMKELVDGLMFTYDSVISLKSVTKKDKARPKYSVSDRTNLNFHWAFNNWGDNPFNGLLKMDGPYELRTSFSSYQLSENYAVVMTDHIKLSIGVGYESDVYKFVDNYVVFDDNGALVACSQDDANAASGVSGTSLGDWNSRYVTRYVTMPVEFEYRDMGVLNGFRFALGVVPGLAFNSKHTGMKHELECSGRNYQDVQEGVSKYLNPYKLDVRVTFKRKGFGIFLQVPTMPLFIDTATKIYPIKIGFYI